MSTQHPDKRNPQKYRCLGLCAVCLFFSVVCFFLLLAIFLEVLKIPAGIQMMPLGALILLIYHKIALPILVYLAGILRSLFPWPAFGALVLAMIVWGPRRISEMIGTIGKIELPGGIRFEGRSLPSKEFQHELGEAAKIVDEANKAIGLAYDGAKEFAAQLREQTEIPRLISELAKLVAEKVGGSCPDDYRLTLYVPDFIFSDRLFQLTEYYNKSGERVSNESSGRTFSIRYGIIGRVWRSGIHEIEGELIPPGERQQATGDIARFIARRWGLSLREATHAEKYNSYGAIRLDKADEAVGLLYFDSRRLNAFGDGKSLENTILSLVRDGPLIEKLLEISSEVAPWSGKIQIYRNP